MILLFDVDGTLTPSRGLMDPDFKQFFKKLPNFSLVTGSDFPKTIEQVGLDIFNLAEYSFNCSGNDVYSKGKHIAKNNWKPSTDLLDYLSKCLEKSSYPEKYGNHIEIRTGMLNFSIVGRNAIGKQRKDYYNWDVQMLERDRICRGIKSHFPELCAEVGGETGVDIYQVGNDKSQCLKYFGGQPIHFFGDSCHVGGNDYSIASKLESRSDCKVSKVKDWAETWEILQKYMNLQTVD